MKFTKYQQNGGNRWKVDFTVERKRVRQQGFRTKYEAEQYVSKMLTDKRYRKLMLNKESQIKFSTFAQDYLKEYSKKKRVINLNYAT